jgi:Cytochrome c
MIKKILMVFFGLILLCIIGFYIWIESSWDRTYDIEYPNLQSSLDSSIISRGQYLVNGPAHCSGCHVGSYKAMIKSDMEGGVPLMGGVRFPLGPLGTIASNNLTPDKETGIGRYTDGEIFRMMRHAVKPDGTGSLSLMMPFWNMADEDMIAVVSYLRSLDPIKNEVAPAEWTFMGKMIRVLTPTFEPVYNPSPPDRSPPIEATLERGEYLARYVSNCVGCHTPRDPQTFEATGPEFSGGMEMEPLPALHIELGIDPDLWTRSNNITPHPNSALSKFRTAEQWIRRFRQGRLIMQSPMPWGSFSRMCDEDLKALYIYLLSLEPIEQEIGEISFKKE